MIVSSASGASRLEVRCCRLRRRRYWQGDRDAGAVHSKRSSTLKDLDIDLDLTRRSTATVGGKEVGGDKTSKARAYDGNSHLFRRRRRDCHDDEDDDDNAARLAKEGCRSPMDARGRGGGGLRQQRGRWTAYRSLIVYAFEVAGRREEAEEEEVSWQRMAMGNRSRQRREYWSFDQRNLLGPHDADNGGDRNRSEHTHTLSSHSLLDITLPPLRVQVHTLSTLSNPATVPLQIFLPSPSALCALHTVTLMAKLKASAHPHHHSYKLRHTTRSSWRQHRCQAAEAKTWLVSSGRPKNWPLVLNLKY